MDPTLDSASKLCALNGTAAFNRWCGKSQVFTACEMYAETAKGEVLVATGETLLVPVPGA